NWRTSPMLPSKRSVIWLSVYLLRSHFILPCWWISFILKDAIAAHVGPSSFFFAPLPSLPALASAVLAAVRCASSSFCASWTACVLSFRAACACATRRSAAVRSLCAAASLGASAGFAASAGLGVSAGLAASAGLTVPAGLAAGSGGVTASTLAASARAF